MKEYNNKKYIYSVKQANELIELGYKCIGTGFNANSQRFYWIFDYQQIQTYYKLKEN